jgi:Family of unknown function (DUF6493)
MEKKPKNTALSVAQKAMLAEYDDLVKSRKLSLLLPFLEANANGNREILKKQVKKNKRLFMNWENRGNENQIKIIVLSEIALFNSSDAKSWELYQLLTNLDITQYDTYNIDFAILRWAKPTWLGDYLLAQNRSAWQSFSYKTLRFFENEGLLDFNPELFAQCVISIGASDFQNDNPRHLTRPIENILNDKIIYERDIPQLFNYEIALQNQVYYPIVDGKRATDYVSYWDKIFLRLIAENKMDRMFFIENALQIQTKDWNKNLQGFYRKILTELELTSAELVALQHTIFTFLHSPFTPIVSYGVDLIKQMHEQTDFDTTAFLEWAEPVLMRSDCKTAIKSLLVVFDKISKKQPELKGKLAELVADVFVVADMTLQERAAKSFLKMADPKNADICAKMAEYAPLLQGSVTLLLADFLTNNTAPEQVLETYAFAPEKPKLLTSPVILPKTWNDIVFHFGKFIQSDEPLDGEILLNIYITQRDLFPADYAEQLKPYFKQMEDTYFLPQKDMIKQFVLGKIENLNKKARLNTQYYINTKVLFLIKDIVEKAQEKIQISNTFSLLSLPTHAPHFIAPKTLLERLIHLEQSNEKIDYTDFAIAISRMVRENVAEALPLLDKLSDKYKPLMRFCLGLSKNIGIENQNVAANFLTKLVVAAGGHTQTADDIALWAVAARSFYPLETFSEFEKTYLVDVPFVKEPYRPQISFVERWEDVYNYQTRKSVRTLTGHEIGFSDVLYKTMPQHLLYGIGIMDKHVYWDSNYAKIIQWHSVLPQNTDSLAYHLLKYVANRADGASPELKAFLQITNRPEFWFSESTTLVFATCFFQEKKEIRLMASEVLMNLIQIKKIEVQHLGEKMAWLLTNKYAGVQRLSDALVAIKDISALHNSALFLLLDAFFQHFEATEKLPTNFKKLVELYTDLKTKTQGESHEKVVLFFEKWKGNTAVRSFPVSS